MKYPKNVIKEAISYWKNLLEQMNEAGADDILARWNQAHRKEEPKTDAVADVNNDQKDVKITSYKMGNDTHLLYKGDWIIGMFMLRDSNRADYAIYRMSKLRSHLFKSLKGKTLTSTLKNFLINNAEKIEGEERGSWTLMDFVIEMKRLVGPEIYERVPVLFTAGMQSTNYHYSTNPRHRGKTTYTTLTTGHITYDLKDILFDGNKFIGYAGKTKTLMQSEGKNMKKQYTKQLIEEAIAHWKNVLESIDDDPEIESLIKNAKANVETISDMINTIESDGALPQYSEIVGSLYEFNDWCQELMDKSIM